MHNRGGIRWRMLAIIGIKRTLVAGLILQGLASLSSGLSYSYLQLEFSRAIGGIGGSIFIVAAFGAVIVWFQDSQVTLALGIGTGVTFGYTAWFSVPARVGKIRHEYAGTSAGLMMTLAAVGGFFVPIIFGRQVTHTSFTFGWEFLAAITFAFALIGLLGRNPADDATGATILVPVEEATAGSRTRPAS